MVRPRVATDDAATLGVHDLVVLSVKAHVLPALAPAIATMIGPDTIVLRLQNGIPRWYFQRLDGPHAERRVAAVDPNGILAEHIPSGSNIGCVVCPDGETVRPGVVRHVVRHIEGRRLTIGELDGSDSSRLRQLATLLNDAGFDTFPIRDIRAEIWLRLLGNVSLNHICALTGATMAEACQYGHTRTLARRMMEEAQAIATRPVVTIRLPIDKRIEGAEKVGHHRPSTLQDVEAGRPLELSTQIAAVLELAGLTGVNTPHTTSVHALVSLLDHNLQQRHVLQRLQQPEYDDSTGSATA